MPDEAQAQTPDITGTWTGTGTVNSGLGIANLTVTFVVSSQTGGNYNGTIQIESADWDPIVIYGRIDSLLSLWQTHAVGSIYGLPMRLQGFYTPGVPLLTTASITLDSEYFGEFIPGDSEAYNLPLVFHVTLTKT